MDGIPEPPRQPADRGDLGAFLPWLARKALSTSYGLLYHQLAPVYDLVSWVVSGGRWRDWQLVALVDLPAGHVLEVGPGTGHLLVDLLDSGRDAYGLERSPEMLRIAARRLSTRGYRGRLIAGDARALPFPDGTLDGLVLTFPAPFLDNSFWREARRVIRPGGRAVVVLGAESRHWPWPGVLEWVLASLAGESSGRAGDEIALATGLVGRLVDRRVDGGVVRVLVAERDAKVP